MRNFRVNRNFYLGFLCILFLGAQFVGATGTFQNNLQKVNIFKNPNGGVKILLVTNKPYGDSVVVNKKSDFEYVILLPETSNSMTAKPSLKLVSADVKNIDVKTQQYQNQVKGYTKLVISTTKPIVITPQIQTINSSSYKSSEKYYNSLLAQSNKKPAVAKKALQPTKTLSKTTSQAVAKKKVLSNSKPHPSKKISKSITKKPAVAPIKKQPIPLQKKKAAPIAVKNEGIKIKQIQPKAPVTNPVPVAQAVKTVKPEKISLEKMPVEKKINTVQTAPVGKFENSAENKIVPNVEPKAETKAVEKPAQNSLIDIQKIKQIIKDNIYTISGLVLAPLILILLALKFAKKSNKNVKQQDSTFAESLMEEALLAEAADEGEGESVEEGEEWQDRFQSYVDESHPEAVDAAVSQDIVIQNNTEVDELFNEEVEEETPAFEFIEESQEEIAEIAEEDYYQEQPYEPSNFDEGIISEYDEIGNENVDTLLDSDEVLEETPVEVVEEQDEMIQSEFEIDDKKGFYLVDFEDITALVGHIEDEIFVLKRFDEKINAPLQARLNETKGNSASYMAKVGKFKGIVEVTSDNMNLLIEL